jgi:hypothetical protein
VLVSTHDKRKHHRQQTHPTYMALELENQYSRSTSLVIL